MSDPLDNLPEEAVRAGSRFFDENRDTSGVEAVLRHLRDNDPAFLLAVALSEDALSRATFALEHIHAPYTMDDRDIATRDLFRAALALHEKGENDG